MGDLLVAATAALLGRAAALDAHGSVRASTMSVLLQISDTHFGTEQPPVVAALLQLAQRVKPAVVVVSGDITQRARRVTKMERFRLNRSNAWRRVCALPRTIN